MGQSKCLWVLLLLVFSSLTGCLSEDQSEASISLTVVADIENTTLVETYSNGELVSITNISIVYDFSQTTADLQLVTFGIDPMDGRPSTTVDATAESQIQLNFENHGIYNIIAYAIDSNGGEQRTNLTLRIDLMIDWTESNTRDPLPLIFDPNPVNGGPNPTMVEIQSTVENPSFLENLDSSSQSVQVTWNIVDELDDVCQQKTAQIDDGESDNWYTLHFNTFLVHELEVAYDDGQDMVDISHLVTILYSSLVVYSHKVLLNSRSYATSLTTTVFTKRHEEDWYQMEGTGCCRPKWKNRHRDWFKYGYWLPNGSRISG